MAVKLFKCVKIADSEQKKKKLFKIFTKEKKKNDKQKKKITNWTRKHKKAYTFPSFFTNSPPKNWVFDWLPQFSLQIETLSLRLKCHHQFINSLVNIVDVFFNPKRFTIKIINIDSSLSLFFWSLLEMLHVFRNDGNKF